MDEIWRIDDVVQVSPTHDERFGGALLVVTEVMGWGVQGYVQMPGQGQAYYRLPFKPTKEGCTVTGRFIGKAYWLTDARD